MFPITKLPGKKTFLSRVRLMVEAPLRLASQTAEAIADVKHETTSKEPLPFDEIPGPRGKLLTGIDFYRYSEGFRKHHKLSVRLFNEYGPIFKEHVLQKTPVVHVMEPDDFEKVYRAEGKYPKRRPMDFVEDYRKRNNRPKGLESMNNEEWQRVRQALAPKVMRPKVLEENIDNFNAVTRDAVKRLVKIRETNGEVPDLEGELSKWSTEAVGTYVFDARIGLFDDPPSEQGTRFVQAVHDFFDNSHYLMFDAVERTLYSFANTPKFRKVCQALDVMNDIGSKFVDDKIKELDKMATRKDESQEIKDASLLEYLLAKKELSYDEISSNALSLLGAGVDTTSVSSLWCLYNLARHPEVQEKLHQEVISVLGEDGDVTPGSLAKMSYLKACVKESSRLNPVFLANERILPTDVVLSGYLVPAGTVIHLEFYATAVSEKHFKNALEYKPERWLRENKREINAFAFLPFGFGPRMCLGSRIAELEMHMLAAKISQRFRIEYHYEPLDLYQQLSARPEKPVKIKFVDL